MSQTAQTDRRVVSLPGRSDLEPVDPSEAPSPDELGQSEDDILRALTAAAETDEEVIAITRRGKVVLRFTVESTTQDTYDRCRLESVIKERAKAYANLRLNVDVDRPGFNSRLIYHATTDTDRKKIWDNKTAWRKYNVLCGWDLVAKVLRNFEMDKVVDRIDLLSGADPETEAEQLDVAGNS